MGSDFDAGYQPAGIYGWRKQCLYATVLFILIIVIMNLALTVWILRVLDFSIEGLHMGNIHMTDDGVHVDGEVEVVKTLYTSKIKSLQDTPVNIESSGGVMIRARNNKSVVTNTMKIGNNKFEAACDRFEIRDSAGKRRFTATEKGLKYYIDEVKYNGKVIFNGSVATPNIRGPLKGPLRMESVTSSIIMDGQKKILLEAPEGEIKIQSTGIYLNTTNIFMKKLVKSSPKLQGKSYNDVYQLCMCQNGKLFLAPPDGQCVADSVLCVH